MEVSMLPAHLQLPCLCVSIPPSPLPLVVPRLQQHVLIPAEPPCLLLGVLTIQPSGREQPEQWCCSLFRFARTNRREVLLAKFFWFSERILRNYWHLAARNSIKSEGMKTWQASLLPYWGKKRTHVFFFLQFSCFSIKISPLCVGVFKGCLNGFGQASADLALGILTFC